MEILLQTFKSKERYKVYSWVNRKKSSKVIGFEKMVKVQVINK
jgi:hypothetical protein